MHTNATNQIEYETNDRHNPLRITPCILDTFFTFQRSGPLTVGKLKTKRSKNQQFKRNHSVLIK